jgi:hypothetical protein
MKNIEGRKSRATVPFYANNHRREKETKEKKKQGKMQCKKKFAVYQ